MKYIFLLYFSFSVISFGLAQGSNLLTNAQQEENVITQFSTTNTKSNDKSLTLFGKNPMTKDSTHFTLSQFYNYYRGALEKKMALLGLNIRDTSLRNIEMRKTTNSGFRNFGQNELSKLLTGNAGSQLVSNAANISIANPTLTLNLAYWCGKENPGTTKKINSNYDEVVDSIYKPKFFDGKRRLFGTRLSYDTVKNIRCKTALSLEVDAGTQNSLAQLFSTGGNVINSNLEMKPGITLLFPTIFCTGSKAKNSNKALIKRMAENYFRLDNQLQASKCTLDQSLAKDLADSCKKSDSIDINDTYKKSVKALSTGFAATLDSIFYAFPFKYTYYNWLTFTGDAAYHVYDRFNNAPAPGTNPYFDSVKYWSWSAGVKYSFYLQGKPRRWCNVLYFSTGLSFNHNTNAANGVPIQFKTSTQKTVNDSTTITNSSQGVAYLPSDLVLHYSMSWNTNLVWFWDPQRIFGLNAYSTIVMQINNPSIVTLGQGIVFAIPPAKTQGTKGSSSKSSGAAASASSTSSVTNFTLYVEEVSSTATNKAVTGSPFKATLGIKVGVPFGVFGM